MDKLRALPIKGNWFELIIRGIKLQEYRDFTEFYVSFFRGVVGNEQMARVLVGHTSEPFRIKLRNGYSSHSPYAVIEASLLLAQGLPEWGAEKGKIYFVLDIHRVVEVVK